MDHSFANMNVKQNHDLHELLDDMQTFVGILDLEGRLVFVNRAPVLAAGIEKKEVIGKPIWDCPWFNYSEKVQDSIKQNFASALLGHSVKFEELIQMNQSFIWVDVSITPIFDEKGKITHLVPEGQVITERKEMEFALRDREQRFRKYFELGIMGMAITSIEKGWVEFNTTLHNMMGYTREEFSQLTWAILTHPEDLGPDIKQFNRVLSGEIDGYSLEKRFIHKNGTTIHAMISANAVRKECGEIDYFVALIHDITKLKLTEKQVQDLKNELEVRINCSHDLEDENKQLITISETDFLTKLSNRRVYDKRLKECISSAKRDQKSLSLLMIDIDHFKEYNDNYGHDEGDNALQKVAQAIENSLPRKTDFAARFGGEEFVVLLPSTDSDGAIEVSEKIRFNIKELKIKHEYSKVDKVLTVSIGASTLTSHEIDEIKLLKNADKALYKAKKSGKNKCKFCSS